jgi:hypothetical protein
MRKAYSTTLTIARQDGFEAARATYQPFPRHLQYGTMFPCPGGRDGVVRGGRRGMADTPRTRAVFSELGVFYVSSG